MSDREARLEKAFAAARERLNVANRSEPVRDAWTQAESVARAALAEPPGGRVEPPIWARLIVIQAAIGAHLMAMREHRSGPGTEYDDADSAIERQRKKLSAIISVLAAEPPGETGLGKEGLLALLRGEWHAPAALGHRCNEMCEQFHCSICGQPATQERPCTTVGVAWHDDCRDATVGPPASEQPGAAPSAPAVDGKVKSAIPEQPEAGERDKELAEAREATIRLTEERDAARDVAGRECRARCDLQDENTRLCKLAEARVVLQRLADEECENGIEAIGETCTAVAKDPDNEGESDYPYQHWCGPCIAKAILAPNPFSVSEKQPAPTEVGPRDPHVICELDLVEDCRAPNGVQEACVADDCTLRVQGFCKSKGGRVPHKQRRDCIDWHSAAPPLVPEKQIAPTSSRRDDKEIERLRGALERILRCTDDREAEGVARAALYPSEKPLPEAAEDGPTSWWVMPDGSRGVSRDWICAKCGHQHVTGLGGICVGCPCPESFAPPPSSKSLPEGRSQPAVPEKDHECGKQPGECEATCGSALKDGVAPAWAACVCDQEEGDSECPVHGADECGACRAKWTAIDPSWRWNGRAWEHKCPGLHPQAGHFRANGPPRPLPAEQQSQSPAAPVTALSEEGRWTVRAGDKCMRCDKKVVSACLPHEFKGCDEHMAEHDEHPSPWHIVAVRPPSPAAAPVGLSDEGGERE